MLFKRCIEEKADKIMPADKSEELQLWMDKVKWIELRVVCSKCLGLKYDPSALGVTNLHKYLHEFHNFI